MFENLAFRKSSQLEKEKNQQFKRSLKPRKCKKNILYKTAFVKKKPSLKIRIIFFMLGLVKKNINIKKLHETSLL